MRVESMSSRLDFDERRARALEGVVQYRPGAVAPLQPPATGAGAARASGRCQPKPSSPNAAPGGGGGAAGDGPDQRGGSAGRATRRRGRRRATTQDDARRRFEPADEPASRPIAARANRTSREARGRRPALRRGHQRRRGAARALHRRTPVAARRGRGRHDLRARLRHVAERAAGRRRAGQRRHGAALSGRARAQAARVRPPVARRCSTTPHSIADELAWLESEGPASPALVDYVARAAAGFDFVIFFSYRYYHAWHGARRVAGKAVLVPTAERDPAIGLSIFGPIFRGVRAIMYNSHEERAMIQAAAGNAARARRRRRRRLGRAGRAPTRSASGASSRCERPFAIYIGRIDENKGCGELFDYFQRYARDVPARPGPGARRQAR